MNSTKSDIGEIIMYQPDETIRLEVRLEDETVWLTQAQMAELFQTTRNNITLHIGNIFKEGELHEFSVRKESLLTAKDGKKYQTKFYNLDVIISVGYRVKSQRGTQFRQWANQIIKEYMLRGYSINYQMQKFEQKIDGQQAEIQDIKHTLVAHQEKIDFFVQTNQPPVVGIFYQGQLFSARLFVETLIKAAKQEVILIDNYVDAKTLDLLDVRNTGVQATIYTEQLNPSLARLVQLHNQEFPSAPVRVLACSHPFHDRFLIVDDELWHCGASFKDLGRRLFAIDKLCIDKNIILNQL